MNVNGCPSPDKCCYDSRKLAKLAYKRAKGNGHRDERNTAYLCVCGFWHLGRVPVGGGPPKSRRQRVEYCERAACHAEATVMVQVGASEIGLCGACSAALRARAAWIASARPTISAAPARLAPPSKDAA